MKRIRLSKSSISNVELTAVAEVLEKEYLGMGEHVSFFEQEIKKFLNTSKQVVCVNTGTSALHLALLGAGVGFGDEVLVPSLTYVATFQAVSASGAKPVPCDVLPDNLFLDTNDAKNRITDKTKAILPVHYASDSSRMNEVYELARDNNLRVIEDAAHSFGCKRQGKKIGVDGDVICFSFDGIKNITSGEGGAILSGDDELIQLCQDARLLSVEKDTEKRYSGTRSWEFDVKNQGFRYHMSNIMAAIGRAQLKRYPDFSIARKRLAEFYLKNLKIAEIVFLKLDYENIVPHIFVVRAKNRDELRLFLDNAGIETGIHYKPNHLLSLFKSEYHLPETEKAYNDIISLPCHADLTQDEQVYVIEQIKKFYE